MSFLIFFQDWKLVVSLFSLYTFSAAFIHITRLYYGSKTSLPVEGTNMDGTCSFESAYFTSIFLYEVGWIFLVTGYVFYCFQSSYSVFNDTIVVVVLQTFICITLFRCLCLPFYWILTKKWWNFWWKSCFVMTNRMVLIRIWPHERFLTIKLGGVFILT
jgi:hypothetical protein